jgi:hypothetical protein
MTISSSTTSLILILLSIFLIQTSNGQQISSRVGEQLMYYSNQLVPLNNSFTFPQLQSFKQLLWLFNNDDKNTKALFDATVPQRDPQLSSQYRCSPNDQECSQLTINKVSYNHLGVYRSQIRDANYQTFATVTYNVSSYLLPIKFDCENKSQCIYNASRLAVTVLAERPIKFTCSVIIAQGYDMPIPAQLNFFSQQSGEECKDIETQMNKLTPQEMSQELYNSGQIPSGISFYRLSKNCTRTFSKQEINMQYSCLLNPLPIRDNEFGQFKQNNSYESWQTILNIEYGPDLTGPLDNINRTISSLNTVTSFTCPFNGNPSPKYQWRIVSADVNKTANKMLENERRSLQPSFDYFEGNQVYTTQRDLEVGVYVLECKATVNGLVTKQTDPFTFVLRIDGN